MKLLRKQAMIYEPADADFLRKLEIEPAKFNVHGTDDDIREHLKPLKTRNWRLEGNQLSCDTDMGPLTQTIPMGYICKGTDTNGQPILQKIQV